MSADSDATAARGDGRRDPLDGAADVGGLHRGVGGDGELLTDRLQHGQLVGAAGGLRRGGTAGLLALRPTTPNPASAAASASPVAIVAAGASIAGSVPDVAASSPSLPAQAVSASIPATAPTVAVRLVTLLAWCVGSP